MNRIAKVIIVLTVCALTVIPEYQSASACQVDEFYLTKEGTLAASTPEILSEAIKLEDVGNKEELAGLQGSGSVMRLKGDVKVRVLERSFEFKSLKIELPDGKDPYWVKDGTLKQINCN